MFIINGNFPWILCWEEFHRLVGFNKMERRHKRKSNSLCFVRKQDKMTYTDIREFQRAYLDVCSSWQCGIWYILQVLVDRSMNVLPYKHQCCLQKPAMQTIGRISIKTKQKQTNIRSIKNNQISSNIWTNSPLDIDLGPLL